MSQPLLTILGAILIQESFREAMRTNPKQALKDYGIVLSRREHEILGRMIQSLRDRQLDLAIAEFSKGGGPCPVWPCEDLALVKFDEADYPTTV
jgi:hypothetical protein